MDYYDSEDDNLELIRDYGEDEEEIVDLDREVVNVEVEGTSDVNDNRHLSAPGVSAHEELSRDDNGNLVRDALYEEVSDAEDSDDEQTLVMLKRKKGPGVIFVGKLSNPKKETRLQLLDTSSMLMQINPRLLR